MVGGGAGFFDEIIPAFFFHALHFYFPLRFGDTSLTSESELSVSVKSESLDKELSESTDFLVVFFIADVLPIFDYCF